MKDSLNSLWTTSSILKATTVNLQYTAYHRLQPCAIGSYQLAGWRKKGCVSIPVAHCFVWQCLFRCKSASKSVTSCQCMEGGTSGPTRRKLAWRDWDPREGRDGVPYCSLGDIILSPSKSGHPGCYTSSAPLNTSWPRPVWCSVIALIIVLL